MPFSEGLHMRRGLVLLVPLVLIGCTNVTHTYALDGSYGTLAYRGGVSRTSSGDNFVYTLERLSLTFEPTAQVNATKKISAPQLCFVTTAKPPKPGPWLRTFRTCVSTQLHLDGEHRNGEIANIKFVVPKHKVLAAGHVGFDVTDPVSKLAWPLHEDLKE